MFYLLLVFLITVGITILLSKIIADDFGSPVIANEKGELILSPERQNKLNKELDEIDNAVQYVLYATLDGYFPCYSCPDGSTIIFLYENEVWRYGVTRKGEQRRYPGANYGVPNVRYVEQFEGTYSECLKMEKIKIYHYPLLPEANNRIIKLFRPPGNKNDN